MIAVRKSLPVAEWLNGRFNLFLLAMVIFFTWLCIWCGLGVWTLVAVMASTKLWPPSLIPGPCWLWVITTMGLPLLVVLVWMICPDTPEPSNPPFEEEPTKEGEVPVEFRV